MRGTRLLRPSQVRPFEGGSLLVEDEKTGRELKDEILLLNRYGEVERRIPIKGRRVGDDAELRVVYDWTPLGSKGILAFGDLCYEPDGTKCGRWESAFLHFGFEDDGKADIFYRMEPSSGDTNFYLLGHQRYLAAIGDTGYILWVNGKPAVWEVKPGVEGFRELPEFPDEFCNSLRLTRKPEWRGLREGPRQQTEFYSAVQATKGVVGLVAWEDHLHLLAKEAMSEAQTTAWYLIRIDTRDGTEMGRSPLPTSAPNLLVVPGETWALIEKERARFFDGPLIRATSMVLVPGTWITERLSGNQPIQLSNRCQPLPR